MRWIYAGAALFVTTVIGLQITQPQYDYRYQLMSELALGPYGVLMLAAFIGLAVATFGFAAVMKKHSAPVSFWGLQIAAGCALLIAGVVSLSQSLTIHIIAVAIAFVCLGLSMLLFYRLGGSLRSPAATRFSLAAGAALIACVIGGHTVFPMGIGQRLAVSVILVWLVVVGNMVSNYARER